MIFNINNRMTYYYHSRDINLKIEDCCLLDENSPQLEFEHDTIRLFQHQKTLLYKMNEFEESIEKDIFTINDQDEFIQSNIGVICDMVGSGKTYCILSQILRKSKVDNIKYRIFTSKPLIYNNISKHFHLSSIKRNCNVRTLNVNFIIVPNVVYAQWVSYINKFCIGKYKDINVRYIFGKKAVENECNKELDDLFNEKYQIILASSNYWNSYYKKYLSDYPFYERIREENVQFSRFIIDEVDTIDIGKKIKSEISMLPCSFYWLISSNYENLFYPNGIVLNKTNTINGFLYMNYLKVFFGSFDKEKFAKIFISNTNEWIQKSIQIPHIEYIEYIASDIIEDHIENLIKYGGCEKIVNFLNCNDWDGLSAYTNCNVKSPKDLYEFLTNELQIQIENRRIEIEYRNRMRHSETTTNRELIEYQNKTTKIEEQCKSLEIRKETLKNNIENIEKDECPICTEKIKNPLFVRCCYHHFCSECLMNCFLVNKKDNCPLCRQEIKKSMMFFVNENYKKISNGVNVSNKSKFDLMYEILNQRNENSRILIFVDKSSLFDKLVKEFNSRSILFNKFTGSIFSINNIIKKYENGEIPILLLNATSYGTGLNLQNTTDIILLNRMDRCLEAQIIGRAQRIGRNTVCRVHYIMYRNEKV